MVSVVRSSKFRHMFADKPKPEDEFRGFKLASASSEMQYLKANPKYFALAISGGGGPIAIIDHSDPSTSKRVSCDLPHLAGHKGNITDFDFNPFNDQILATGAEDTLVKIWTIPDAGLTESQTESTITLAGHQRKLSVLRFHPTASNILASAGADHVVKVWDIEVGKEVRSCDDVHEQNITDLVWDYTGTQYATACKDKKIRLIDARANAVATECKQAHDGPKSVKLCFLGRQDRLVSVGFTRGCSREAKLWDPRKMDVALKTLSLGQAPGVFMPHFDEDINVLYLCAKGDTSIKYFEMKNDDFMELSQYQSSDSTKGIGFMSKRGVNVKTCEAARAFKITQGQGGVGIVQKLSFVVPRKGTDNFQADIYPPTYAGVASHTAAEWLNGSNAAPMSLSMNPKDDGKVEKQDLEQKEYVAPKTMSELKEYIAKLEAKLKEANITLPE